MRLSELKTLYDYNYWVLGRLLPAAAALPVAELTRSNNFTAGSLHANLHHMLSAEIAWLARWKGETPDRPSAESLPTIAAFEKRWKRQEADLRAYLDSLNEEKVAAPYTHLRGDADVTTPLWVVMLHLANHFTEHRSEVAEMLTMAGHSPGQLDFLPYYLEKHSPAK